jgi:hypothetical protein
VWHHYDESRIAVGTKKILVTGSGTAEDLFTFGRTSSAGGLVRQCLVGSLIVAVEGRTSGGTKCFITKTIPIFISGYSTETINVSFGTEITLEDNAAGGTLVVAAKAGTSATSATIQATFSLGSFDDAEMTAYLDVKPLRRTTVSGFSVSPVAA